MKTNMEKDSTLFEPVVLLTLKWQRQPTWPLTTHYDALRDVASYC